MLQIDFEINLIIPINGKRNIPKAFRMNIIDKAAAKSSFDLMIGAIDTIAVPPQIDDPEAIKENNFYQF